MPKIPARRLRSLMAGFAACTGILVLGACRPVSASPPYQFGYAVEGARCLPKLVFSSRRDLYLWMDRNPLCRPVTATVQEGARAKAVPIFRERPYWVVAGLAPRVTIRLVDGRMILRTRALGHLRTGEPEGLPCPSTGSGRGPPGQAHTPPSLCAGTPAGQVKPPVGHRVAMGSRPDAHRTLPAGLSARASSGRDPLWIVSPGTLHRQLQKWAQKAGYQLVWHDSDDYLLTAHAEIPGSFVHAASVLIDGLDQAGSTVRITVYRENRVLIVSGGA